MTENNPKNIAGLIQVEAQKDIARAADQLRAFANTYLPLTQAEFKTDFLKAGVVIATNQADPVQKEQSLKKLQVEISILAEEILQEYEKKHAQSSQNKHQLILHSQVKTYLGSNKIVIECNGIVKRFKREKFKLGEFNFNFRLGEITGLVGLNSHGKSTLLKILAKELQPDQGDVEYLSPFPENGSEISKNTKLRIGYLPQELPKEFGRVKENLQLTAALAGLYGKDNDFEVEYLLHRWGLFEKRDTPYSPLSGGFKLRYAIAKLLVKKPHVLILDEPLANLDFKAQGNLLKDLDSLARSNKYPVSVIISSQHIEEVESVSDNMIVLNKGQLVYAGKTNEVYKDGPHNLFQIHSKLDFNELKLRFSNLEYQSIMHEGFYTFIYIPKHITREKFLEYCYGNQIDVKQFNDISNSVKRLVLENNNE